MRPVRYTAGHQWGKTVVGNREFRKIRTRTLPPTESLLTLLGGGRAHAGIPKDRAHLLGGGLPVRVTVRVPGRSDPDRHRRRDFAGQRQKAKFRCLRGLVPIPAETSTAAVCWTWQQR
jgi:hypothetical protein